MSCCVHSITIRLLYISKGSSPCRSTGTSAAHFDGGIDPRTKAVRVRQIQSQARDDSERFRQRSLGTTREVLWERPKDENSVLWTGLTDNYIRVEGRSTRMLANEITPALLCRQEEDLVVSQVLP